MARQNEIDCFNRIKKAFLHNEQIQIFCNCNLNVIAEYIFKAEPNKNSNEFPDFIFAGGGIEHFELTSSEETKKGSKFKIEEKRNDNNYEEWLNKEKENFLKSEYNPQTMRVKKHTEVYEDFSYPNFLYSLKRNITNHIESLKKSSWRDKIMIFVMEQKTSRLNVFEGSSFRSFYELHKDKNALSIIKEHCKDINYLIYLAIDSIEILDLSKIDDLLEKSIIYKKVGGGRLIVGHLNLFIDP